MPERSVKEFPTVKVRFQHTLGRTAGGGATGHTREVNTATTVQNNIIITMNLILA